LNAIRIDIARPSLEGNELRYVSECIETGWVSSAGRFVTLFEQMFADFTGTTHGVAVTSGTAALHVALTALGIGPGMEVIVPALTFVAPANAVLYAGATPVIVDVDPATWTLSPAAVAAAITSRTRAIVAVHLYGQPCEMDAIRAIARTHDLFVIEDAAEAHGATHRGRPVGGMGNVGCFSFYGNKAVTTGEGGICVTDDPQLASRMRLLRDHGMTPGRRYWHDVVGFNYRMTNLQAAVGVAQMERIGSLLEKRSQVAAAYRDRLASIPGLTVPADMPWSQRVCWLYTILIDQPEFGADRDTVIQAMATAGIETRPMFHPVNILPPYRHSPPCPVAERLSPAGVSLPSHPSLGLDEIQQVCDALVACSGR
jgi:perosamine synthetase